MVQGMKRLYFRNDWESFVFSANDESDVINYNEKKNNLSNIHMVYIGNSQGELIPYKTYRFNVSRSYFDHGHRSVVTSADYYISQPVLGGMFTASIPLSDAVKKLAVYVKESDISYVTLR